jgi:DNA-binding CsgD family transcriptional regulator
MPSSHLRPLERRVLRLSGEGLDDAEIARRFNRSPRFIRQVLDLTEVERSGTGSSSAGGLRPLERRRLRWRESGAGYDEPAPRFRRSPGFLARVEELARWREAGR